MTEAKEFKCGLCGRKLVEGTDPIIGLTRWSNPVEYKMSVAFCKNRKDCAEIAERLWNTVKEFSDSKPIRVPGCELGPGKDKEKCSKGNCD